MKNPLPHFSSLRFRGPRLGLLGGNGTRDAGRPLSLRTERKDLFGCLFSLSECTWATRRAPSAVRAGTRTEAAEAELHAERGERWARSKRKIPEHRVWDADGEERDHARLEN